jgi:hypothetical protein
MTPHTVLSGFQSTGISPFNLDVSEADFAPATLTDRPIGIAPTETNGLNPPQVVRDNTSSSVTSQQVVIPGPTVQTRTQDSNVPSTSTHDGDASRKSETSALISS